MIRKFYDPAKEGSSGSTAKTTAADKKAQKKDEETSKSTKEEISEETKVPTKEEPPLQQEVQSESQSKLGRELTDEELENQKKERIAEVKKFRVQADSLFLSAKTLPSSREVSCAITAFQSARQFMGLILGCIGAAYPYKESMDANTPQVNPRQDVGEVLIEEGLHGATTVDQKLAFFRKKAEEVIGAWNSYVQRQRYYDPKHAVALHEALSGLLSGKMWLGEELARRKETALQG